MGQGLSFGWSTDPRTSTSAARTAKIFTLGSRKSMNERKRIRVLVADDFAMMRQIIHMVIERTDDIEAIGDAPNLQDALKAMHTWQPDVILMNDYLPPTTSATATEMFRALDIPAAILIISMTVEPVLIRQCLVCGANGFMHKDEMGKLLAEAIRQVHNKERYLSPMAKQALLYDTT